MWMDFGIVIESGELQTPLGSSGPDGLTIRGCQLGPDLHWASLLEASLQAKAPGSRH